MKSKSYYIFILVSVFIFSSPFAVKSQENPDKVFQSMLGTWKGYGWMKTQEGKSTFTSSEVVTSKLGGRVIHIEGKHLSSMSDSRGEVVHDALAIISYNQRNKRYEFSSFLADGKQGVYEIKNENKRIVWTIPIRGKEQVRFTIDFSKPGEWIEIGEHTSDGSNWVQFFEMKLKQEK